MAYFFYPPPPPFMGGQQPHAPRRLPAGISGFSVDNPGAPLSFSVVMLQPFPSIDTFMGKKLPISATAVPVNDPPFDSRWSGAENLTITLTGWIPPPPLPTLIRYLPLVITAVPANDPPFDSRGAGAETLNVVLYGWVPPPPLPTLIRYLPLTATAVPVDNPPFDSRGAGSEVLNVVLYGWTPLPPLPTRIRYLPVSTTAVPVDNPPFRNPTRTSSMMSVLYTPLPIAPIIQKVKVVIGVAPPPVVGGSKRRGPGFMYGGFGKTKT